MPMMSQKQNAAMHAAAEGKSTLGIPKSVGSDFVNASQGEKVSALPEYVDAQRGHKAKSRTHRGRRSKGKGAKPMGAAEHHAEAKTYLAKAQAAPTPQASTAHLFKALSSLKKAKAAAPAAPDTDMDGM